ncbi:MAG: cytochrome c3 family protein [Candidatus Methylopumilus sp.]|jgi:predicted CXXCH cytochrome family protein
MAEKQKNAPLIEEILGAQKIRKGRRLLSWFLFLTLLMACLLIPYGVSMHPDEAATFVKEHPWAEQTVKQLAKLGITPAPTRKMDDASINKKLLPFTADAQNFRHTRSTQPAFLSLDKVWNPGHELDSAHKPWANDCKVCHSTPFVQVQDKDCQSCHRNIGDHVDRKTATVSALADQKCASCHREHNGEDSLAKQNKSYMTENCASCHGDIKKSFAKTKTGNVEDFATKHPEFRYQLALSSKPKDLERTRLIKGQMLKEKTALKFPHDVHLKADGVKSPKGKVKVECASCHKPNPDGLGFAQVTMKDHCQSCHDLKFEPAVSNREVPHGSVELVLSTLREFYSYVQVNAVPIDSSPLTAPINLVRPGKDLPRVASFVHSNGNSRSRASEAAISLFEKTSCKVCHEISRVSEPGRQGTSGRDLPQWKVAPLTPRHPWLTQSQFNHAKHRIADCTDCHAANKSKKAEEVLMPAIKVCRDCHTGSTPESNKLVSDCGLCHGFHLPGHEASKGSTRQDTLKSIIKSALDKTTVKPDTSTSGTIKSSSAQLNEGEMH